MTSSGTKIPNQLINRLHHFHRSMMMTQLNMKRLLLHTKVRSRFLGGIFFLCIALQGTNIVRFYADNAVEHEQSYLDNDAGCLKDGCMAAMFVTILVDDLGSCPSKCGFIHTLLPKWVKFQYSTFSNHHKDLTDANHSNNYANLQTGERVLFQDQKYKEWWTGQVVAANDTDEQIQILEDGEEIAVAVYRKNICRQSPQHPCRQEPFHTSLHKAAEQSSSHFQHMSHSKNWHHHILVVTRKNVEEIAQWAAWYKQQQQSTSTSVGMFLMADEKLKRHDLLKKSALYANLDYVLRNYWFSPHRFGMPLQALGNLTCGTVAAAAVTPIPSALPQPKHGIHWVFLQPHEHNVLLQGRSAANAWPTSLRHQNCTFVGWKGVGPGGKARAALAETVARPKYADLHCEVQLQKGFDGGADDSNSNHPTSKFEYLSGLLNSKIGFNPRGVHPECHRLPELLASGTVPAMVHEEYMDYVPMRLISGILGRSWEEVIDQLQKYLEADKGIMRLEIMARDGTQWWNDLQGCMQSDMEKILVNIMNDDAKGSIVSKM
jgi:hypothetical protein